MAQMPTKTNYISMKNILVAVDLTDMDETLIRYAHFLQKKLNLSIVHFVHNIKGYEVDDVLEDLLEGKDIHALIEKSLKTKISKVFTQDNAYSLNILEHDSTEYNLKVWAKKHQVDTILLGFKQEQLGTAAMAQKLIRMFKGNVMLVPKTASFEWNHILVPTDLSAPFQLIIEKLKLLRQLNPQPEVRILKSFGIPSLFFPFVDDKRAIKQAHEHIDKQYAEVKRKYAVPHEVIFSARYQGDQSVVDIIQEESRRFQADLIIMSAKGASKIPSIFIGSTINEIINTNPFQVIYILKQG